MCIRDRDRHKVSHKINYPGMAWLIFHDGRDADSAVMLINGERNYREGDAWGNRMAAKISTSACIVCREDEMGTWNIFRPRTAKFLIDHPLEIHENVDNNIVSFSADIEWCAFCNHGWHKRENCPILADMLYRTRGKQYECYKCLAINHHHWENCRVPVVRGAANIAEIRRRQQHNIGV